MKRVSSLMFALAMTVALAAPVSAADNAPDSNASRQDVRLLTTETAAVTRGDASWVLLNWTSAGDAVEDFRVVLRKAPPVGVVVSYPVNTSDHTSLASDATLAAGEVDYTALSVSVDPAFSSSSVELKLELQFQVGNQRYKQRHDVTVPVVTFTGDPVSQTTRDWGTVTAGHAGWFSVGFAGHAPAVSDFSVVVTEPEGVIVTYPQGDHTSLHFDSILRSRETDVVRLHLDTSGLGPGQYLFDVSASYVFDGVAHSEVESVSLTLAP